MPMSPMLVEMVALICAGSVDTLPERGGLTALLAASGEGGYWQSAPVSPGGATAGNGGTVAAGVAVSAPDPARMGTLPRVGVGDAASFAGGSLFVTRAMTNAATAISARADAPTMPMSKRLDWVAGV